MIRNGRDIASGTEISAQVCIIGSGPAGVTAAWHLQKAGIRVVLIEGSRYVGQPDASWPDKKLLYAGEAVGVFANSEPDFLIRPYDGWSSPLERERILGGTSSHWGGQSRPLSAITFEDRPGYTGWPISRADLDPYYAQAVDFCRLYANEFDADYWAGVLQAQVPALDGFDIEMYQFIDPPYLNVATRTFPDGTTLANCGVDVILNASLQKIEHTGGHVQRLSVASMDMDLARPPTKATGFFVKADVFVLACGAVANAHQLLLSNAGNEHDQVGRYFGCHPLSNGGVISANGYLKPDQVRLMNGKTPDGQPWHPPGSNSQLRVEGRFVPDSATLRREGIGACWFWAGGGQCYFEMAPNADSRITLSEKKDAVFGLPEVKIDWQLSDLDQRTYEVTASLFKASVAKLGGQAWAADWAAVKAQMTVNGHHIGTTRMSSEPKDGVVDANLKVHSIDNLYVAGSSVFRTPGISNPTFTIIALSMRLAEHLRLTLAK
ncbi:MAG: GMC family oxidoreductase [Pseudomonadota bacterium]